MKGRAYPWQAAPPTDITSHLRCSRRACCGLLLMPHVNQLIASIHRSLQSQGVQPGSLRWHRPPHGCRQRRRLGKPLQLPPLPSSLRQAPQRLGREPQRTVSMSQHPVPSFPSQPCPVTRQRSPETASREGRSLRRRPLPAAGRKPSPTADLTFQAGRRRGVRWTLVLAPGEMDGGQARQSTRCTRTSTSRLVLLISTAAAQQMDRSRGRRPVSPQLCLAKHLKVRAS